MFDHKVLFIFFSGEIVGAPVSFAKSVPQLQT